MSLTPRIHDGGSATGPAPALREAFAVDPVSPYSKVIRAGEFVYVKSNIGMNDDGTMPESIRDEAKAVMEHLTHLGGLAGADVRNYVKLNVYVADVVTHADDVSTAILAFLRERGTPTPPALTLVGAPLSWPQLRVQIDGIATTGEPPHGS